MEVDIVKVEMAQRITKKKDLLALRNSEMRDVFRSFVWSDLEEHGRYEY